MLLRWRQRCCLYLCHHHHLLLPFRFLLTLSLPRAFPTIVLTSVKWGCFTSAAAASSSRTRQTAAFPAAPVYPCEETLLKANTVQEEGLGGALLSLLASLPLHALIHLLLLPLPSLSPFGILCGASYMYMPSN